MYSGFRKLDSYLPEKATMKRRADFYPQKHKKALKIKAFLFSSSFVLQNMVGVTGFEPAASWSRTKRSTMLSHTPLQQ